MAYAGAVKRYGEITPQVRERLEYELAVIAKMSYSTYFLIVWDFVRFSHEHGIAVGPGRGSAAGSLVSYALEITGVDPLRYHLIFERFLNPDRVSMPDFDIDFCIRGRDRVIDYVRTKYGGERWWERIAQIATYDRMAARSVVRDVGRVLGLPYGETDRIAKLIPFGSKLKAAVDSVAELRTLVEENPDVRRIVDIGLRLEDLTRNISTHAAGVVIAPDALAEHVPLLRVGKDEFVTQYDMTDVEAIGLLKIDFLGLRNLTMIQDTLELLASHTGVRLDLEIASARRRTDVRAPPRRKDERHLPAGRLGDDGPHSPSPAQPFRGLDRPPRSLPTRAARERDDRRVRRAPPRPPYSHLRPSERSRDPRGHVRPPDLPGPAHADDAEAGRVHARRGGHACERPWGRRTRRSWQSLRAKFIEGCIANGLTQDLAATTFDDMEKFSRYGFNQSHSTAYAFVSYWTAYLKAHHPTHFMAGLLTSVQGDSDKVAEYIGECRQLGIAVLPPDINESSSAFAPVREGAIRFGLGAIKYVGANAIEAVLAARASGGFASFFDMCRRIEAEGLDREALEALVRVGAFDRLGATRRGLLRHLPEGLELMQVSRRERQTGQRSMFADLADAGADPVVREEEFDRPDLLAFEKELLGLYITAHPLDEYAERLATYCLPLRELADLPEGQFALIGGRVKGLRRVDTRRGGQMAFVMIEDGASQVEVTVFPRTLEASGSLLCEDSLIAARVQVGRRNGEANVVMEEVFPLDEVAQHSAVCMMLVLDSAQLDSVTLGQVVALLQRYPGPTPVRLCVSDTAGDCVVIVSAGAEFTVAPNESLRSSLAALAGVLDIVIESEDKR